MRSRYPHFSSLEPQANHILPKSYNNIDSGVAALGATIKRLVVKDGFRFFERQSVAGSAGEELVRAQASRYAKLSDASYTSKWTQRVSLAINMQWNNTVATPAIASWSKIYVLHLCR